MGGCDAAFGCDHDFLDRLPDTVYYFAAVRENECIYLSTHCGYAPNPPGRGRRVKHPRALEAPIRIQELTLDESIVWERRVLAQGTKGPIHS